MVLKSRLSPFELWFPFLDKSKKSLTAILSRAGPTMSLRFEFDIVTQGHILCIDKVLNDMGICGSTLLYYNNAQIIQTCGGGTYNKWFGVSRHIGAFGNIKAPINTKSVEAKMDYVVGASMLISKILLNDVGIMSEDYFLYFEDIDWSTRAKNNYILGYAPDSIVYHKEGESSGAGRNSKQKSMLSDYYSIRGRLLFTRKFTPFALPTVYLGLLATIFNRIVRRQYDRVGMIIKLSLNYHKTDKYYKGLTK